MNQTVTTVKHDPCAYLAHDLRAPLMSVKGLLDLMRRENKKENYDFYFGLIETSVEKMNQAITDLIGHLQSGPNEIVPKQVDLRKIAEEAIQSMRYMAGAESVRIYVSAEKGGAFYSDYNAIYSIFSNFLSNAIRYRDKDKLSTLTITITYGKKSAQILFEDNGIGIDESAQQKIFDRFYRVNQDQTGSGLGLSIVKSLIEKLQGSVHVQSQIGKGTTFSIELPNLLVQ